MFDPQAYGDEIAGILALDGSGERLMPLAGGTCSSAEARGLLKASRLPPAVLAGLFRAGTRRTAWRRTSRRRREVTGTQ